MAKESRAEDAKDRICYVAHILHYQFLSSPLFSTDILDHKTKSQCRYMLACTTAKQLEFGALYVDQHHLDDDIPR